jgi:hypothetical protein
MASPLRTSQGRYGTMVKDIENNKDNGITTKNTPGPKDVVGLYVVKDRCKIESQQNTQEWCYISY